MNNLSHFKTFFSGTNELPWLNLGLLFWDGKVVKVNQ